MERYSVSCLSDGWARLETVFLEWLAFGARARRAVPASRAVHRGTGTVFPGCFLSEWKRNLLFLCGVIHGFSVNPEESYNLFGDRCCGRTTESGVTEWAAAPVSALCGESPNLTVFFIPSLY